MKNIRRLLVTTAAIGGLMALTATSDAIGPGYSVDSPSREGASQSRESRELGEDSTGTAPGGEVDRRSGCMRRDGGSGTGTGGSMDTAEKGYGTGTGSGGAVESGNVENRPVGVDSATR